MEIETIKITHKDITIEMTTDELKQFYLDLKLWFGDIQMHTTPFTQTFDKVQFPPNYTVTCSDNVEAPALDPNAPVC